MTFVKSIKTDSGGNYRTDLIADNYMVLAEMPGFSAARAWNVYINPGAERIVDMGVQVWEADYKPGMAPSLNIAGTITSETGLPVPDATITVVSVDNFDRVFQARSNSNGQYVVRPFYAGRYIVYAAKGESSGKPMAVQVPTKGRCNFMLAPRTD